MADATKKLPSWRGLNRMLVLALSLVLSLAASQSASAQGVVWNLPEAEGTFVRYAGQYKNIQERPTSNDGPLELVFDTELTIKVLGDTMEDINGESTLCRWLEFKLVAGKGTEQGLRAGPYGTRVYKILVPISKYVGAMFDEDGLPVTSLPMVRGYRKIGERPATRLDGTTLSFYPLLSLVSHYKDFAPVGEAAEDVELPPLGTMPGRLHKGTEQQESAISRTLNEGSIWLSSEVPFGWLKYEARVIREEKVATASREDFVKKAEIESSMAMVEIGAIATTDISDADIAELDAAFEAAQGETPEAEAESE